MKIHFFLLVFFFFGHSFYAQEKKGNTTDDALKETIYNSNKKAVLNYSMKDFEQLFFEFNNKKSSPNVILTKEEFYTYTVKIAIFSDRLAILYPKEKEVAEANKKRWMSESYEDYLHSKQTQKK
ncbi:hypothetical protein [Flavobacterium sp. WC2509]|uniref:hypothetical protein n=1 Tax=Flavobacterium sp. WC2509 TaxID=3461406 RepID=UPI0040439C80